MQRVAAAGILEKLLEFERVASVLDMPTEERLGILNLPAELYAALRGGDIEAVQRVKPELERRLSYALPVMRRLATNSSVLRISAPMNRAAA